MRIQADNRQMVLVEWIDAALYPEWTDEPNGANVIPVETTGFLLSKDTRVLKIAQSISANKRYSAIQSIPANMVVSVNTLAVKPKGKRRMKR